MAWLIYPASYLVALFVGHISVKILMKRFRPPEASGIPRAGALIGLLERALTLTLVLAGEYTAIALVLTAKSIARYKELQDQKFAEYYLVGTLSSILFAIVVGIGAKWAGGFIAE